MKNCDHDLKDLIGKSVGWLRCLKCGDMIYTDPQDGVVREIGIS